MSAQPGNAEHPAIGLDFGTTNSAIAWRTGDGSAQLAEFAAGDKRTSTFRSVVYFDRGEDE
ncbi:MAG: hypothetical protein ACR2PQ_06270 [Myxococcota bacterium]